MSNLNDVENEVVQTHHYLRKRSSEDLVYECDAEGSPHQICLQAKHNKILKSEKGEHKEKVAAMRPEYISKAHHIRINKLITMGQSPAEIAQCIREDADPDEILPTEEQFENFIQSCLQTSAEGHCRVEKADFDSHDGNRVLMAEACRSTEKVRKGTAQRVLF